jgi:type I restriction-modification system DNA methylase subunit
MAQQELFESYASINRQLSETREFFHSEGRFGDSNAKLDEIAKIFAICFAYAKNLIEARRPPFATDEVIVRLQDSFEEVVKLARLCDSQGQSVFGSDTVLHFQAGDEPIVERLLRLVTTAVSSATEFSAKQQSFDALNEIFGHFVRDNFRSNVEDAQYMTPPEVVDFISNLTIELLEKSDDAWAENRELIVIDPCCGVGSFLSSFYQRALRLKPSAKVRLVGQDKVQRMVRLSAINLLLFNDDKFSISSGNSLSMDSPLGAFNGRADVVLTNPPFGARFSARAIGSFGPQSLPIFAPLANRLSSVDSELLFVDRDLALLRDGGFLLIVVPDGVISAKGIAAIVRSGVVRSARVRAIVELPSVTFAQAGTRTKTAVLVLEKCRPEKDDRTFLAQAETLGFEVGSRKGVNLKRIEGTNDLLEIEKSFKRSISEVGAGPILNDKPACVVLPEAEVIGGSWTPKHYSPSRIQAIEAISRESTVNSRKLKDIVEFIEDEKVERWQSGSSFISVLHIISEGVIDIDGIRDYQPKTPGFRVKPGDILVSRINPRIPRVLVVPHLSSRILCSSEFAILRSTEYDPYFVAYLLLSKLAQSQIRTLTSGTSASHNRIRSSDLENVVLGIPKIGSSQAAALHHLVSEYKSNILNLLEASIAVTELRDREISWLGPEVA